MHLGTYFVVSAALNFSGAGQIFVQHITSHLDALWCIHEHWNSRANLPHTQKRKRRCSIILIPLGEEFAQHSVSNTTLWKILPMPGPESTFWVRTVLLKVIMHRTCFVIVEVMFQKYRILVAVPRALYFWLTSSHSSCSGRTRVQYEGCWKFLSPTRKDTS